MLCPGRTASINLKNKNIGYVGEINPEISNDLKLDFNPIVFELNHEILNFTSYELVRISNNIHENKCRYVHD